MDTARPETSSVADLATGAADEPLLGDGGRPARPVLVVDLDEIPAAGLEQALRELEKPREADASRIASCRAGLDKDLAGERAKAEAALDRGDRARAETAIKAIDERYGGVAADAIAELESRLGRAD